MDHKPLSAIFGPKTGISPLAVAWLQYKIELRPMGEHGKAKGLSWLPIKGVKPIKSHLTKWMSYLSVFTDSELLLSLTHY